MHYDWMAKLNFPADVQGGAVIVRRRMRAKNTGNSSWKRLVRTKTVSLALSDSQLPVKMDRFDPTYCKDAMNEIENARQLRLREHYSVNR